MTLQDGQSKILGDGSKLPEFPSKYVNVMQAADYCCLSKSSLDKLRMTGEGPTFIKLGKKVVYELSDLDIWMQSRKFASTTAA